MSIVLELPQPLETALADGAKRLGITLPEYALKLLSAERSRFERHFGSVDLGKPTGTDNAGIDADLARSFGGDD